MRAEDGCCNGGRCYRFVIHPSIERGKKNKKFFAAIRVSGCECGSGVVSSLFFAAFVFFFGLEMVGAATDVVLSRNEGVYVRLKIFFFFLWLGKGEGGMLCCCGWFRIIIR